MLWRLISTSTEQELVAAFAEETITKTPTSLTICTLATTEEKRSAISYWEQFPLQTFDNVQTWMRSLERMPNTEDMAPQSSTPGEERAPESWRVADDSRPNYLEPDPTEQYDSQFEFDNTTAAPQRNSVMPVAHDELPSSESGPPDKGLETSRPPDGPSLLNSSAVARKFGLSSEFQETFLW